MDPRAVRQTAKARLDALRASTRRLEAAAAEEQWLACCPAYGSAREQPPPDSDVVVTDGLTWHIPKEERDHGLTERLRRGWLPWHELLMQRVLGVGTAMIDVGANIGTTSICRVVAGDMQRVYAIEAEPTNFGCLVHNIVANGIAGFVLADQCAIADAIGHAPLRRSSAIGNHALMAPDARGSRRKTISVPVSTLDAWVDRHQIDRQLIGFIKVDTQGWEAQVLAGSPGLVAQAHTSWMIEVSPKHLANAGTTVPDLLARLAVSFSHAIDLRGDSRVVRIGELGGALGYLGPGGRASYTNLLLYHGEPA